MLNRLHPCACLVQGVRALEWEEAPASLVTTVWLLRFDESEEIQAEAASLWEERYAVHVCVYVCVRARACV